MKSKNQSIFWNSFARKYDKFIHKHTSKAYNQLIPLIQKEMEKQFEILEIGCGTGLITFSVADCVKSVTAIDFAPEMIKISKDKLSESEFKNINLIVNQANKLDFPDKSFDVVIASNVLHLVNKIDETLWEMHRVLKNQGKIIVPTYCHGQNLKTRILSLIMGLSGFKAVNRWSVTSFKNYIKNEGFTINTEQIIADKIPLSFLTAIKSN